jgi:ribonuclease Z
MIDICLLGTSGMMPMPWRWISCALVRTGSSLTLIDCGEGTQIPWKSLGWGFRQLGTICLTHMHADHVAGLPGVLFMVAHAGRTEPIHIYGPQGTSYILEGLLRLSPELPFELIIHELQGSKSFPIMHNFEVTSIVAEHGVPCLAYRFDLSREREFLPQKARALGIPVQEWSRLQHGIPITYTGRVIEPGEVLGTARHGIAFSYITDTRPMVRLSQASKDVDLMICESMYADESDFSLALKHKHMLARESASLALEAQAKSLILTHFSPKVVDTAIAEKAAQKVFPKTQAGYDGMITTLHFSE